MSAVDRFPLAWPSGWKRTKTIDRRRAAFGKTVLRGPVESQWKRKGELASFDAAERLEYQLDRLGATAATLSTNQPLRLDGRPKSNIAEPPDPGAAVYFTLNGQERCLACDKWDRVADNIAALAAHVDAIRRIDRYGVGDLNQAFAGYVGLPAKGQTWRSTLGFGPDDPVDAAAIERAFRSRARDVHPDAPTGNHDAMASLSAARAEALQAIGAARPMEFR